MGSILRHRGPDDEGYLLCAERQAGAGRGSRHPRAVFEQRCRTCRVRSPQRVTRPRLILGHRRPAIIDLSAAGHQPMSYADRYWIVVNGEVYNYVELRQRTRAQGLRAPTDSRHRGHPRGVPAVGRSVPRALQRHVGDRASAIGRRQRLVLSRDRLRREAAQLRAGRPRTGLRVGSEGGARDRPRCGRTAEPAARDRLPALVCRQPHGRDDVFTGVRSCPPGRLTLDRRPPLARGSGRRPSGALVQPASAGPEVRRPGRGVAARGRELLEDAVRLRLRSDVPVGSCLSGGLDSSAIVCQAQALRRPADGSDERLRCRVRRCDASTSRRYAQIGRPPGRRGCTVTFATPTGVLSEWSTTLLWHQEEPFRPPPSTRSGCVMRRRAGARIPVMLDGQGADEVLCGYRGSSGVTSRHSRARVGGGRWRAGDPSRGRLQLAAHGDRTVWRSARGLALPPAAIARRARRRAGPTPRPAARDDWAASARAGGRTSSTCAQRRSTSCPCQLPIAAALRGPQFDGLVDGGPCAVPRLPARRMADSADRGQDRRRRGQGPFVRACADWCPTRSSIDATRWVS